MLFGLLVLPLEHFNLLPKINLLLLMHLLFFFGYGLVLAKESLGFVDNEITEHLYTVRLCYWLALKELCNFCDSRPHFILFLR